MSRRIAALTVSLACVACGGDDSEPATTSTTTTTTETTTGSGGAGGTSATGGGGAAPTACDLLAADFQAALDTGRQNAGARGALLGVVTPECGKWTGASGDSTPADPMKPEHLGRIGSVTKTFVSAALLDLASGGGISLDDPVSTWVASFPGADAITLRQLLNHTSGIFNYTDDPDWVDAILATPDKKWAPQELVDVAAAHAPYFAPGAGWHYSNTNYVLAGMILEIATQSTAAVQLRSRLFDPVALGDTTLDGDEPLAGELAHGWSGATDVTTYFDPSIAWTAGAIVSSTSDLVDWAMALYDGTEVLDAAAKAELFETVATGQPGVEYGLGVLTLETGAGVVWGHDGSIPGFQTQMFYLPDRHVAFAAITNDDNGPNDISVEVLDVLSK